jgi:hypothetical protein
VVLPLPLLSILVGESRLLISWCAGHRCIMVGSDKDRGRSRRPGVKDRGWLSTGRVLGGRRSGGRVTLCVVCTMHKETRSVSFLVEPQNQDRWFISDLTSKPLGRISRFGHQNRYLRFGDLGLKITATVYCFVPQNQTSYGLSVAPHNRWKDEDGTGHAS